MMKLSLVRPKIAGIESSAKMTLASPSAATTTTIGVNIRRPLTRVVSLPHAMLVLLRHREPRHDDDEHEEVVDREAVLGHVTGEELRAAGGPAKTSRSTPKRPARAT